VDFDHSLNTIINKLREVLGDSAASPRFIETLAKRGYRFLPAVEVVTNREAKGGAVDATETRSDRQVNHQPLTSILTRPEELPRLPQGYVRVLFLLIQVMYLSFYIVALARLSVVEEILRFLHVRTSHRLPRSGMLPGSRWQIENWGCGRSPSVGQVCWP